MDTRLLPPSSLLVSLLFVLIPVLYAQVTQQGIARLVGSTGITGGMAGRVEVYYNNQWTTISVILSSTRYSTEARVICRQLGFQDAIYYGRVGELGYEPASSQTQLIVLTCFGFESSWNDCFFSDFDSFGSHTDDLAIMCTGTYSYPGVLATLPQQGDLRLNVGGSSRPFSGRLEIYINDEWGTVCDDMFQQNEADTACKQLGLLGALYYGNVEDLGFQDGSGQIWLDDVRCRSSTGSLLHCSHRFLGFNNCHHNEDVALVCLGEGSLRLISDAIGSSSAGLSSGRLEVFTGGQWGTVCDDSFDQTDGDKACMQLGYSRATSYNNVRFPSDYNTSLPILLDDVQCSSDDNYLLLCDRATDHNCFHYEDVELYCSSVGVASLIAIGVVVPIIVIVIIVIISCCLCYQCKRSKSTSHLTPRVVSMVQTSATAVRTTNAPSTAYPMQPLHQPTFSTLTGYPLSNAPYPTNQTTPQPYQTGQYNSPPFLPTSYSQQPPAPYPTGQFPPALYSSGVVAPPPSGHRDGNDKSELYSDAPPTYTEVVQYPANTGGPLAPAPPE